MLYVTGFLASIASFMSVDPVTGHVTRLADLPNSSHRLVPSILVDGEQLFYITWDASSYCNKEQYTFNFTTMEWDLVPFKPDVSQPEDGEVVYIGERKFHAYYDETIRMCKMCICTENATVIRYGTDQLQISRLTFPSFLRTCLARKVNSSTIEEIEYV